MTFIDFLLQRCWLFPGTELSRLSSYKAHAGSPGPSLQASLLGSAASSDKQREQGQKEERPNPGRVTCPLGRFGSSNNFSESQFGFLKSRGGITDPFTVRIRENEK